MGQGRLTLVGMGPGPRRFLTMDAVARLAAAAEDPRTIAYAAPGADELAATCAPGLAVAPLPSLPEWRPNDRNASFTGLVQRLFAEAFRDGRHVLYLAHGNPLVVGDFARLLRQTAFRYGKRVDIVPGLSFFDLVLQRVFWKADPGLQLLSAWRVATGTVRVRPDCPALLYEIDELGPPGSEPRLGWLGRISETFPPDHPVGVLTADEAADDGMHVESMPLVATGAIDLKGPTSLWLPSLEGPESERALLSELPAR